MRSLFLNKVYEDNSWDFRTADTKTTVQGFHSYPAMMIPQVAKRLIELYGKKKGILLDPFCGSGSSLVEAKLKGLCSYGIDINPLARLIAKVKTTLIEPKKIEKYIREVKSEIGKALCKFPSAKNQIKTPDFKNIDFWFKKEVIKKLAILKDIILRVSIDNSDIRDFLLVVFSHTVRECSNTRSSEFKLYRMPKEKLVNYNPDVFQIFLEKLEYNYRGMLAFYDECTKLKNYKDIWVKILNEDTRKKTSIPSESIDIVVTSPPYGDSRTTVAYGQFSRLSSQWLGIDHSKHDIDKISLGGTPIENLDNHIDSINLNRVLNEIAQKDLKRAKEVLSFYIDLDKCMKEIKRVMKPKGYICIVVGNRTVKEVQIPTDKILVEMSRKYNLHHIETIIRNIPNKRMPSKNSPTNIRGRLSSTMVKEYIVILKNG